MSQEHSPTSPTSLTSRFLRKAKFRTVSATHSEEGDLIPGLSKPPDGVEDRHSQSQGSREDTPPSPGNQALTVKQEPEAKSPPVHEESEIVSSESNDPAESPVVPNSSPLPPKLEIQPPTHPTHPPELERQSPSMLCRTTSPEPSISDVTDSIMSSPQGTSTDTEIIPAESTEETQEGLRDTTINFSPEELDQAKNLVLDLLGWGVDPEYLVNSGVSPQMIIRVFTDLNLQLPKNLEVSEELMNEAYSWGPQPDFAQSVG